MTSSASLYLMTMTFLKVPESYRVHLVSSYAIISRTIIDRANMDIEIKWILARGISIAMFTFWVGPILHVNIKVVHIATARISWKWWQTGKSTISIVTGFRLAYLHLTVVHSKDRGQFGAYVSFHFDCLRNWSTFGISPFVGYTLRRLISESYRLVDQTLRSTSESYRLVDQTLRSTSTNAEIANFVVLALITFSRTRL